MALLEFDRIPRNPEKHTLGFLESEVENYLTSKQLESNLAEHRKSLQELCTSGHPAMSATDPSGKGKGKDKDKGKRKGKEIGKRTESSDPSKSKGKGCFICGDKQHLAAECFNKPQMGFPAERQTRCQGQRKGQ